MARTGYIICNICYSKAIIKKTERLNNELSVLYCRCTNNQCKHQFVINQEFSHTTKSSLLTKDQLLRLTISMLSSKEKEDLKTLLCN